MPVIYRIKIYQTCPYMSTDNTHIVFYIYIGTYMKMLLKSVRESIINNHINPSTKKQ